MKFRSLRAELLFWLLVPLALVALLDAWVTYHGAHETAKIVQERMLLGAARMIGEQVHPEEGIVQVTIPPAAIELFSSPIGDRVFYRITEKNGELLSGYLDLALPSKMPRPEGIVYFDAEIRKRAVHVVAFSQPVLAAPEKGPVLIEVAQTLDGRDALAREFWIAAARRQAGMLILVSLLLWFGLWRGMKPLLQLRARILSRKPGVLEPFNDSAVPYELAPVVSALNDYVRRLDAHISSHSRFIADASHQLRTPLTILNTQLVFAIRNKSAQEREEALVAVHATVAQSIRLVNQLLAYARAEAGTGPNIALVEVDLLLVTHDVLEELAPLAFQRQIDLGFEHSDAQSALVMGPSRLLREMVINLVDNALRYSPQGGIVTTQIIVTDEHVILQLDDSGPGIPAQDRERVFERFTRLGNNDSDGCGLGLAIVKEVVKMCQAKVTMSTPPAGKGLRVSVSFARLQVP